MARDNLLKACSVFLFIGLTACERDIRYRGNLLNDRDYKELQSKKLSKTEIIKQFGFPTLYLSDNEWLYVSQKVEYKAFLKPVVLSTDAIKIIFKSDSDYVAKKVPLRNIGLTPLGTKTQIKEDNITFLEQLQKNIQRMGK